MMLVFARSKCKKNICAAAPCWRASALLALARICRSMAAAACPWETDGGNDFFTGKKCGYNLGPPSSKLVYNLI